MTRTKKIFVGGLSVNTTIEDVKQYFDQFGKVKKMHKPTKYLQPSCLSLHSEKLSFSWTAAAQPWSDLDLPFTDNTHHIRYMSILVVFKWQLIDRYVAKLYCINKGTTHINFLINHYHLT